MNGSDSLLHIYESMGISKEIVLYAGQAEERLAPEFAHIDENAQFNQLKVLQAFRKNRISAQHMSGSTGYGYNDAARDDLEQVYADTFHTQSALVRPQITCGTHALALALSANLRPGDELLSVSGKPYDTLEEVIGIRPSVGSLAEFGITYRQIELGEDGHMDLDAIRNGLRPETKVAAIQRSRGYLTRPSFSVEEIGRAIRCIKENRPDVICMVDNCYGEFVEVTEPSDVGADMTVGSLIKNPGGGLAPSGGYITGTKECIERCAVRLTSPGLGKEVGATMDVMRSLYQGFFLSPVVTAAALKGAMLAAALYEPLGFKVNPSASDPRSDIIQSITFGTPEGVIAFCEGIQAAAPVDSYVTPTPWAMPGYDSDVIMAAGAFIQGSSIELSADGPIKPPYNVYFQGGLTYSHAKFGILCSLQKLCDRSLADVKKLVSVS